jgi:hypothetical protein
MDYIIVKQTLLTVHQYCAQALVRKTIPLEWHYYGRDLTQQEQQRIEAERDEFVRVLSLVTEELSSINGESSLEDMLFALREVYGQTPGTYAAYNPIRRRCVVLCAPLDLVACVIEYIAFRNNGVLHSTNCGYGPGIDNPSFSAIDATIDLRHNYESATESARDGTISLPELSDDNRETVSSLYSMVIILAVQGEAIIAKLEWTGAIAHPELSPTGLRTARDKVIEMIRMEALQCAERVAKVRSRVDGCLKKHECPPAAPVAVDPIIMLSKRDYDEMVLEQSRLRDGIAKLEASRVLSEQCLAEERARVVSLTGRNRQVSETLVALDAALTGYKSRFVRLAEQDRHLNALCGNGDKDPFVKLMKIMFDKADMEDKLNLIYPAIATIRELVNKP